MVKMKNIINEAEKFALSEIEKWGAPSKIIFDYSNMKGLELAKMLNVDENIVQIGTRLMDIKLGECYKNGIIQEHIKEGVEETKRFLDRFDLDKETKNKIINCVKTHHGTAPYIFKEAEICANVDCYRFIKARNVFAFIADLSKEGLELDKIIEFVEEKLEEKWNILSLDICKEELKDDYRIVKEFLNKVKL